MTTIRLLAISLLIACTITRAEDEAPKPRPVDRADTRAGKPLYLLECSACHGERGRGDGPAADFLDPLPRDLTKAIFKLRTTESGLPPATGDVLRTIERGIPGTAMPSFSFLSGDERKKIAAYVLELADLMDSPEPEAVAAPADPPPATAESIAQGKTLYEEAQCFTCHGTSGKGDGPSAATLKDSDDRPIRAGDLTANVFKGGSDRLDLFYRISTGMDGTPMPSFADSLEEVERFALVDYVLSLKTPVAEKPFPAEPLKAGRIVIAKYGCQGCHVTDQGKGGQVGPDFRLAGQKLRSEWVARFLKNPREPGKIYPSRPHRMPGLRLSDAEVEVMTRYLTTVGKRKEETPLPDVSRFPAEKIEVGKNLFGIVCARCHALGTIAATPPAEQQGPDLINVAKRVDFEFEKQHATHPEKLDPKTRMEIPPLTPEQVAGVRMFVWKTSIEASRGRE